MLLLKRKGRTSKQLLSANFMLHEIDGDLLESKEKYIVHQANCTSIGAAGLARHMFNKFPYSDIYSCRKRTRIRFDSVRDEPGTIIIRGNGDSERYVIGLMGQYYPGGPSCSEPALDSPKARTKYFQQGLLKVAQIPALESVAFPYQIGCGLAQGDWDIYYKMLRDFSENLVPEADVYIYRLPGME